MSHTKFRTDVPAPSDTVTEEQDLLGLASDFAEDLTYDDGERMQIARDYVSAPVGDKGFIVCTDPSDEDSPLPWCIYGRVIMLLKEKGMTFQGALERLGFTRRQAERPLREAYAAKLWAERNELLD